MSDILFQILAGIVFRYPMALLRWLFYRRRKSFKEILANSNLEFDGCLGVLFVGGIIVLIVYLMAR